MLIYGSGGHGRVVLSAVNATNQSVNTFFDDSSGGDKINGISVIAYSPTVFTGEELLIAIGNNEIRKRLAGMIQHKFGNIVHPSVLMDPNSTWGVGNMILHGSIIQTGVVAGNHIIVNTGAIIDHDCRIGDFVHIAPGAVLCGGVEVGEGTMIGSGSRVVQNISIGRNCLICAGSVVTRNVPDHAVVRGSPAMVIRFK